jgi:hypothetical protein
VSNVALAHVPIRLMVACRRVLLAIGSPGDVVFPPWRPFGDRRYLPFGRALGLSRGRQPRRRTPDRCAMRCCPLREASSLAAEALRVIKARHRATWWSTVQRARWGAPIMVSMAQARCVWCRAEAPVVAEPRVDEGDRYLRKTNASTNLRDLGTEVRQMSTQGTVIHTVQNDYSRRQWGRQLGNTRIGIFHSFLPGALEIATEFEVGWVDTIAHQSDARFRGRCTLTWTRKHNVRRPPAGGGVRRR